MTELLYFEYVCRVQCTFLTIVNAGLVGWFPEADDRIVVVVVHIGGDINCSMGA